jgi:LPS-assembly protein
VPGPHAQPAPNAQNPNLKVRRPPSNTLGGNEVDMRAVTEEADGRWRRLRGSARVETPDVLLEADEIDYNESTGDVLARGNVRYESYVSGDKLQCDHAEFNVDTEIGKYYDVTGTAPPKITSKPGVLTTSNPFYFQAKWVDRIEDKYILHDGFLTDCKLPRPGWTLTGPKFDVVANNRLIAYNAIFRLHGIPLFYFPFFYKSLKKEPRQSGFLTPNLGNSSTRGFIMGIGYYWAINRSTDVLYRPEYFSKRGLANTVEFRAKVRPGTEFGVTFYNVSDRGIPIGNTIQKQGGYNFESTGLVDVGHGFTGRFSIDYLSSFLFRQTFTESFHQAIFSEAHSVGFVAKHWDTYGLNIAMQRDQDFLDANVHPQHVVTIRTIPKVEFLSKDHLISDKVLPLWFSFDTEAGAYSRSQPAGENGAFPGGEVQTPAFVPRVNAAPTLTTVLRWRDFSLVPSFTVHETWYGEAVNPSGTPVSRPFVRSAADLDAVLTLPSVARVFKAPKWLGEEVKHVIEPKAEFRYVSGVGTDFLKTPRFDDLDLLTNTTELDLSITNRLFVKRKDGGVDEMLSWEVRQARYFDPTFGGAVVAGQRSVIASSESVSPFAFLDGPRNYSPVDSTLRFEKRIGVQLTADYDPLRRHITDVGLSTDARFSKWFVSSGYNQVRSTPLLTATANQITGTIGYGNQQRRGFNAAGSVYYDYEKDILEYAVAQVSYNTDCCGYTVQYRRFNFANRDEAQFRIAFSISNIGTFGNMKRQDRLF